MSSATRLGGCAPPRAPPEWVGHFAGAGIARTDVIWWNQAHLYTGDFGAGEQQRSRQNLE